MRYFQKYSYEEDSLGSQSVYFVVSDSYEELFNNEIGTETDIFMLESIKKDLNIDEGSFAIDELPFSINHLSCETDDDVKAMFFCLNATDINYNRYCALFFGESATLADMDFIGKIGNKVSGTDKVWSSNEYGFEINPLRELKFSAYSFDISMLQEAKITGNIYKIVDNESVLVPNIIDRMRADSNAAFAEIFAHNIFFWRDTVVKQYCYFTPTGNLFTIISKLLELTSEILLEKNNIDIDLTLTETNLGIAGQMPTYRYFAVGLGGVALTRWEIESTEVTKQLTLKSDWIPTPTTSSIQISAKMIDPYLFAESERDEEVALEEKSYSMLNYDNIADFLYAIAKSLACYIIPRYVSGDELTFEYTSRQGLVESDFTYIKGASEADFDTSSILSSNKNAYYANANNNAAEGFDSYIQQEPSKNIKLNEADRKSQEDRKNIKLDRLLFSTSPTLISLKKPAGTAGSGKYTVNSIEPLNAVYRDDYLREWSESEYEPVEEPYENEKASYLHSSLYMHVVPAVEPAIATALGSLIPVIRPVSGIVIKINGENLHFNTLSDYVNYVMARDTQYYETEYNLTLPFWNGFSKNTDGSSPSWKNIKLGSKIKLYETIQRFEGTWVEIDVERQYVVVGIERNLQKPETKLKLHALERFAFGTWDSEVTPPIVSFEPSILMKDVLQNISYSDSFINETSPSILSGYAVQQKPDGSLMKAVNKSEFYHYDIGIALTDGSPGESISWQTDGEVYNSAYDFGEAGKVVLLRYSTDGLNISLVGLDEPTSDEDMVYHLGISTGPHSFRLRTWKALLT